MSTVVNLSGARARVAGLPADDAVAQDLLDEQEAWLARRIGQLIGARTETFYVGGGASFAGAYFSDTPHRSRGKLGLRRYTSAATVTDGGAAVDADQFTLIDNGSAIVRSAVSPASWWNGPYVAATYTPSDEIEVRAALYELLKIEVDAAEHSAGLQSEQLGDYAYTRGAVGIDNSRTGRKAVIVSSLLPKRESLVNLAISRSLAVGDPVINRAEPYE